MNLQAVIDNLANRADEILADVRDRKEARSTINDVLAKEFPKLSGGDRQAVGSAVMAILEEEEFFEGNSGRGDWSDAQESDDEE